MTAATDASGPLASEREFDVLGRLLLALQRESDLCDLLQSLDYWPAGLGGYVLEWRNGPRADELRHELIAQLAASESWTLRPEDFAERTDQPMIDPAHRLYLLIRGVPIEFRSCEPVGLDQARQNQFDQLRRSHRQSRRS